MKYTILIDEPGRTYQSGGRTLKTAHRRVEIQKDGQTIADFVRANKSQPTTKHLDELAEANRLLALLNS